MKFRLCLAVIVTMLVITAAANAAPSLQSQISAQLSHPDSWVQARAAYLLGEFGYKSAAPTLTHVLNDTKRTSLVRIHAGIALGRLGDHMGKQFCSDVTARRGWHNAVVSQPAQSEFVMLLAGRVTNGNNRPSAPVGKTIQVCIDADNGLWNSANSAVNDAVGPQKQVLLDRHATAAWSLLANNFYGNKVKQAAILQLALQLNPGDRGIKLELQRLVSSSIQHLGARQTSMMQIAVFAKAREKARQS